jgi:hypothetical protein
MNTTNATALQVNTIDINAKEWFDRVNGNSYFAGYVTINYGQPDSKKIILSFQYGYGDSYIYAGIKALNELGHITATHTAELRDHGIILRSNIQKGCKKRELIEIVIN